MWSSRRDDGGTDDLLEIREVATMPGQEEPCLVLTL